MSVQTVIIFGMAVPLRFIKNSQVIAELRKTLQKLVNDQYDKQWLLYLDQYTVQNPILRTDQMSLIKKEFESQHTKLTLPQDDQELFNLKLEQFHPFRWALTDFAYELCRLFGEVSHQPIECDGAKSSNWSALLYTADNDDEDDLTSQDNHAFNYSVLPDQTTTKDFGIYPCLLEKEILGDCCILVGTGTSSFCKQYVGYQGSKDPHVYEMNLPVTTNHMTLFLEKIQIDSSFVPWPKLFAIDVVG